MIPKITRGGTSFKGAFQYYMHDKEADTRDRVAWTQTLNMRTEDPDKAWKVMAYTAREQDRLKEASGQTRAGRKLEKPVFTFSLSWHPEQTSNKEHMLETANNAIDMLGLSEHEAIIIEHNDEPQKHVHVVVNRVHPLTGLAGDVRNSKRKFSDFAREYEHEHGKIYCKQREENHEKREKGEFVRYREPIIADAWNTTNSGKEFSAALEKQGYTLAQGRKRIVVIDPHGKAHNPARHLESVKQSDFMARLSDVDLSKLPNANEITPSNQTKEPQQSKDKQSEQNKEQASLKELFNMKLETLQEKHKHEYERLKLQHSHRLDASKKRLVKHYNLREQKQNIMTLRDKTQTAPWWKKMLGITKKDRKQLHELTAAYKDDREQCREKINGILGQREEALSDLSYRQGNEYAGLKHSFDQQRGNEHHTFERENSREPSEKTLSIGNSSLDLSL